MAAQQADARLRAAAAKVIWKKAPRKNSAAPIVGGPDRGGPDRGGRSRRVQERAVVQNVVVQNVVVQNVAVIAARAAVNTVAAAIGGEFGSEGRGEYRGGGGSRRGTPRGSWPRRGSS